MADGEFSDEQAKVVDALLLEAVGKSNYQRIALCLQKGADIDAPDAQGRTPLMTAVWNENPDMVEYLLKKNPSLFLKDSDGKNAYELIAACRDATKRESITNIMLRALPDHVRRRAADPGAAARLAEAEAAPALQPADGGKVETGADIRVSKPIVLPPRHSPKGFSL